MSPNYRVVSKHAEAIGASSAEPGEVFSDKDFDSDQKEVLKNLEEQGRVVKAKVDTKTGEDNA